MSEGKSMSINDQQQSNLERMTDEQLDALYLQLQQRFVRIKPKSSKTHVEVMQRLVAIMKERTRRRRQRDDGEQEGEG
jgi:predicted secreted Zn-dependent protease